MSFRVLNLGHRQHSNSRIGVNYNFMIVISNRSNPYVNEIVQYVPIYARRTFLYSAAQSHTSLKLSSVYYRGWRCLGALPLAVKETSFGALRTERDEPPGYRGRNIYCYPSSPCTNPRNALHIFWAVTTCTYEDLFLEFVLRMFSRRKLAFNWTRVAPTLSASIYFNNAKWTFTRF